MTLLATRGPRARRIALVALGSLLAAVVTMPVARAHEPFPPYEPVAPYEDPPFTCTVVDHGTSAPTQTPPSSGAADEPLCVRYDKTNITVSTLEAVDFLAAEPARVTLAAGRCSYWQQDHWLVRLGPMTPPLVEWEGSYWYDAHTGRGAGVLRALRVGGHPADGRAFIEAMRPIIGDEAAGELAPYADEDGGGGASFALPEGFAVESCASPPEPVSS